MWFFWIVGREMESLYGSPRFPESFTWARQFLALGLGVNYGCVEPKSEHP